MPERITDVSALVKALNDHQVNYVLVGGMALLLQGGAHVTFDADLAFARDSDNLDRIVRALEPFHPWPRGMDRSLPFAWDVRAIRNSTLMTLTTDLGDVDLLGETEGVDSFGGLLSRSEEIELGSQVTRVASLADLLAMKLAANRDKDQRHIIELRGLLRIDSEES